MHRGLRAIMLAAALGAAASATGEPFAVRLGNARIGLDAPTGFVDSGFTGSPRLQEYAESLTPASNRILLFALTHADLRRFSVGDAPAFQRYALIATPRALERQTVTPAQFTAFVEDAMQGVPAQLPTGDLRAFLATQPPGTPVVLARTQHDAASTSVLQGIRLPAERPDEEAPPRFMLIGLRMMRLRDRVLNLSLFSGFDSADDPTWVRTTLERWAEALQRLNPQ